MAYNILSYLASPGQAMNFVRDAEKLLEELDAAHPKLYKLWHAVGLARESAKAKDQKGERHPGKGKKRLSIGKKGD